MAKAKSQKPKTKKMDTTGIKKAARKAADKVLKETLAQLPAGGAKTLMECITGIEKCREEKRAISKREKDFKTKIRSDLKLELRHVDEVLKQRRMEPEERNAYCVGVALIKEQIEMDLTPVEKVAVEGMQAKRAQARKTMQELASSGDSGKEIGSAANGHGNGHANGNGQDSDHEESAPADDQAAAVPARNDTLSAAAPLAASSARH